MTKELIEEARQRAAIGADVDPIDAARLLNELANELESQLARAAVPDAATESDYHEGLEEGIKIGRAERDAALRSLVEAAKADPEGVPWQQFWDRLTEDDVLALLDRLEQAEERIDRWMQLVGKGVEERMAAEAERDAALAAIERVRAILDRDDFGDEWEHDEWVYREAAENKLGEIETALDGAPEPEVKP